VYVPCEVACMCEPVWFWSFPALTSLQHVIVSQLRPSGFSTYRCSSSSLSKVRSCPRLRTADHITSAAPFQSILFIPHTDGELIQEMTDESIEALRAVLERAVSAFGLHPIMVLSRVHCDC
jgi:hypothetical protein